MTAVSLVLERVKEEGSELTWSTAYWKAISCLMSPRSNRPPVKRVQRYLLMADIYVRYPRMNKAVKSIDILYQLHLSFAISNECVEFTKMNSRQNFQKLGFHHEKKLNKQITI